MVCVETLLINGDLVRMFQQEQKETCLPYMSLFKGQDQSGKLKITIQIDPIIHIQLCYSMQACQRVLLYTEQINHIVYLTNTSLWAGFEMKNVFLISHFQEEKPFVI